MRFYGEFPKHCGKDIELNEIRNLKQAFDQVQFDR